MDYYFILVKSFFWAEGEEKVSFLLFQFQSKQSVPIRMSEIAGQQLPVRSLQELTSLRSSSSYKKIFPIR